MKENYTNNINKSDIKGRYHGERFVFIICVFIATSFWLLIKLSEVYNVNYDLNIKYQNPPSELRLTKVFDTTLNLNLTARGFAVLQMNLFEDMENLEIDLNNYSVENRGDNEYAIYTSELTENLAEMTGIDEDKIHFSKPVVTFEMEKTGERSVPVIPDYSINFASQYDFYGKVNSIPEFVTVFGPKNIIDSIQSVYTEKLVLNDVKANVAANVGLINPNSELISFLDGEVLVNFEVEKFTESEMTVKINLNNLEYRVQTFPSQVKVYYTVSLKDFNKVQSHQFNIQPVVDNVDVLHVKKLPLKVTQQPDFVRNVRIVPSIVEFLIIK